MLKKIQSREFIFAIISLAMAAILGWMFFYAINFLFQEIQIALNGDASMNTQTTQFNLAGLKGIGITEEKISNQPQALQAIPQPQPTSTQPQAQNAPAPLKSN